METVDICPEPQNLARYEQKQMESKATSQNAAGPAKDSAH